MIIFYITAQAYIFIQNIHQLICHYSLYLLILLIFLSISIKNINFYFIYIFIYIYIGFARTGLEFVGVELGFSGIVFALTKGGFDGLGFMLVVLALTKGGFEDRV